MTICLTIWKRQTIGLTNAHINWQKTRVPGKMNFVEKEIVWRCYVDLQCRSPTGPLRVQSGRDAPTPGPLHSDDEHLHLCLPEIQSLICSNSYRTAADFPAVLLKLS